MIGALRDLAMRGRTWRMVSALVLLAGAVGLLAIPALLLMDTASWMVQTEGSPAGTILFAVAGSIGLIAAIAGIACAVAGAALTAEGAGSRALVFLACLALAVGAARHFSVRLAADARDPVKAREWRTRNEAYWAARWEGIERVEGGMYRLVWKSRKGLPPVELMLPAEDLRPDLEAPPLPEKEGSSPVRLPLVAAEAGGATLTLYLSDEHERVQRPGGPRYRPDPEIAALWVSRKGGEWRYLGIDCDEARILGIAPGASAPGCHSPPSRLARLLPALEGAHRVALRGDAYPATCRMILPYQARPAVLESPGACLGEQNLAALKAAMGLLDRLGRDTAEPPATAERVARVRGATANCETVAKDASQRARDAGARRLHRAACGHATQLAAREVSEQPDEIAPLLLRSLEAGPPAAREIEAGYVGTLLRSLERPGRKDGRDVVHAHVLRIEALGSGKALARPSVEAILSHAEELPGPADPLFERIYDAVRKAPLPPAQSSRRLALLADLHEKAAAADPRSELAWKTRYGTCRERASLGVERETLYACADDLLAAWRDRIARSASFAAFDGEAELALAITRMYAQSAEVAPAGAAALGLRRTRELASARIPPDRTEVFDELDKREAQLARAALPKRRDR